MACSSGLPRLSPAAYLHGRADRAPQSGRALGQPRVFTIPPGVSFLPTLADALLGGELTGTPVALAALPDATIYVPTRRAARALAAVLAERAGRAVLLPRIVPLGDADEGTGDAAAPGLPPAIPPLERRLIMTRLIQVWAATVDRQLLPFGEGVPFRVPGSPADAVSLAGDLEALMDGLATENVDWSALGEAVDTDYSRYFRLTLDFVRIAHERWPAILADRGATDPARRRNAALDWQVARLAAEPPRGPVVVAGSTGSIPATARLIAAIAHLPNGAVVLPGLDLDLDGVGWDAIDEGGVPPTRRRVASPGRQGGHGHPQYNLKRLVEGALGTTREAVRVLGRERPDGPARRRLLSEVLRPADTTDRWAAMLPLDRTALAKEGAAGLALIDAPDEREEALAVAVAMRETLAEPGRTVALVTPERGLARRVAAELGRWGIVAEDSAGVPLTETGPGRLAALAADAAAREFHPTAVLALLAHPDTRLGLDRATLERGAAALEIGALRGPEPRPGLAGIAAALAARRGERGRRDPLPRRRLAEADWSLAADVVRRLESAFAGFPPNEDRPFDLVALAARHDAAVRALRAGPGRTASTASDALDALFDELAATRVEDGAGRSVDGRMPDYPAFFAALARDRSLPPEHRGTHRRLRILGLLEARLLDADRVILGGLDEGIWPPRAETDAFLNRPMRAELGLTPPERRIGQTAHDFAQALGARDVVVSRARKRENAPTVPSRFLERLRAFVGDPVWSEMTAVGERYRRLAAALDRPRPVAAARRPAPQPGAARFPRRISVTDVETLVRDPYAIHARHILRLDPLDAIAVAPAAAERGTIMHDILARFAQACPGELPPDAEARLLALGTEAFRALERAYPELYALWWPGFVRLVPRFIEWERERRGGIAGLYVEQAGAMTFPVAEGEPVQLVGRADRIEFGVGGGATVIDYKTGAPPSNRVVAVGFSPQLTLEAAMLAGGGFAKVPPASDLPALLYVRIGGRDPVVPRPVEPPPKDNRSMAAIVERHVEGLTFLVKRYAVDGAGYLSRPYPQYARTYAPYDHLARVKEWSLAGDPDETPPGAEGEA